MTFFITRRLIPHRWHHSLTPSPWLPAFNTDRYSRNAWSRVIWSPNTEAKCFRFSAVSSLFSEFGVIKIALLEALEADIQAIMSITSATQTDSPVAEDNNTLANSGVRGSIFICAPNGVGFPSFPKAPRRYSNSRLRITLPRFGRSRNGKFRISSCPWIFKDNTREVRSHSRISGVLLSARLEKYDCGYKRKHFPGASRPARPARCAADDFDIGWIWRVSMPFIRMLFFDDNRYLVGHWIYGAFGVHSLLRSGLLELWHWSLQYLSRGLFCGFQEA